MSRLNPDFSRWNAILSNVAMLSINWCLGNMKVPVDNQQNQLRFWKAWQFIDRAPNPVLAMDGCYLRKAEDLRGPQAEPAKIMLL